MKGVALAILPVGLKADELKALERVVPRLSYISKDIKILKNARIPQSAYVRSRDQYRAEDFLLSDLDAPYDKLLIVTGVDLFSGNLNFVFGIAELNGKKTVISTYRLKTHDKLFDERVLKEAVHELGHTFGLRHCANPKCVMHFSNSLSDTDIKDWRFCTKCSKKFSSKTLIYPNPI